MGGTYDPILARRARVIEREIQARQRADAAVRDAKKLKHAIGLRADAALFAQCEHAANGQPLGIWLRDFVSEHLNRDVPRVPPRRVSRAHDPDDDDDDPDDDSGPDYPEDEPDEPDPDPVEELAVRPPAQRVFTREELRQEIRSGCLAAIQEVQAAMNAKQRRPLLPAPESGRWTRLDALFMVLVPAAAWSVWVLWMDPPSVSALARALW